MSKTDGNISTKKPAGAWLSQSSYPILDRAQNRWESIEPRSRTVLLVCAGALLVGFVYAYAWLPAARSRTLNAERIPVLQAKLAAMRAEAEEIKRLLAVPPNNSTNTSTNPADKTGGRSVADLIALQTIFGTNAKISIDNKRAFTVTIPSVSYVAFLDRIDQALSRYRLKVDSLSITAINDAISATAANTKPAGVSLVSVEVVLIDDGEATGRAQAAP